MELSSALELLRNGISQTTNPQTWADLGAGSGLFTTALSRLLPTGSSIIAIDKKTSQISVASGISLRTRTGDFLKMDFEETDGVVMANALHYVKDQRSFLQQLSSKTKRLILVEYNTDKGNQWVPYPISFNTLKSISPKATQIGQEPSAYHKEGMYSALILF